MRSYRLARRSFLAGIGAATGLKVLLGNLEASAQGAPAPPRFLLTHWPVGTIKYNFLPSGSRTDFTPSRILQPFADRALTEDMIVLYGLDAGRIPGPGGGHEKGTPIMTTGAATIGTRAGQPEQDDAIAGGPSFDQIFLNRVPELYKEGSGKGYANAICDSRVDLLEVSTQCLSYSYNTADVSVVGGGRVKQNVPLMPTLSPLDLYTELFAGFAPGGSTDEEAAKLKRALIARKSVLDFALRELNQLHTLAPSSQREKIDFHTESIRKIEQQLTGQIEGQPDGVIMACMPPPRPSADDVGSADGQVRRYDYGNERTQTSDDEIHDRVGRLHMGILKAAFQCDVVRVATFQWSPGTNHVAFKGLYPGEPNSIYMHHPLSHRLTDPRWSLDRNAVPDQVTRDRVEFLTNVFVWYNERMAEFIADLKTTQDFSGGNLLERTIIPYVTEVAESAHTRFPLPALIFGGKALGMQGGQYLNLESQRRPHNDLWLTIAQAYLKTTNPQESLRDETFAQESRTFTGPIEGLWEDPG